MKKYDVRNIDRKNLLQLLKNGVELRCPVCNKLLVYYPKDIQEADYLYSLACPVDDFHYGFFVEDADKLRRIRNEMDKMAMETNKTYSPEKLLKLANRAINNNNHEYAIELLEIALNKTPKDFQFHYLLGAEYAQVGRYQEGITSMERAIALNPTLYIAVFQLGLLYLTEGQAEDAVRTWQGLNDLDSSHPQHYLNLFSQGLQHLIKDEFTECHQYLTKGMTLNQDNPALNQDMQNVLDQIAQTVSSDATASTTEEAQSLAKTTSASVNQIKSSIFLQAYAQENEEDDTIQ